MKKFLTNSLIFAIIVSEIKKGCAVRAFTNTLKKFLTNSLIFDIIVSEIKKERLYC